MAEARNNLKLFYNDKDITKSIDLMECRIRDVSGAESDGLNLLVDQGGKWLKWDVAKNDRLRVTRGGYDSKELYINAIVPEGGAFRIYATGRKCAAQEPEWKSYEDKTLGQIMASCAGENGMGFAAFGVSQDTKYEYLMRAGQKATGFLEEILNRESAVLKVMNGKLTAIGIAYAQNLPSAHVMKIGPDMREAEYICRQDQMWNSVTINSPYGSGKATDTRGLGRPRTINELTVDNDIQAKRWARGILLCHNRKNESLDIDMDFNPGYTAMVRIDVESKSAAAGRWIIDSVEHDLLIGKTKAKLLRCLTSII